ncbi:MAG: zinc-ribbon domain-containing protein [Bacilli bacterium]
MKCVTCGKENEDNAKYCVDCGAALVEASIFDADDPIVQEKPYNPKEVYAKPAMILGIVSLSFGIICCLGPISMVISILCGILAIIFSILSLKTDKRKNAVVGLVCGIIGLVLGILFTIAFIVINSPEFLSYLEQNYPEIWQAYQDAMQGV